MKQAFNLMLSICMRVQQLKLTLFCQLTYMMDMDTANAQCHLRLEDWLKADNFNFSHDFCGICDNMNRTTGRLERFSPRFAAAEKVSR